MLDQISIINWIVKNNIKTEDGTPYTFHDYMFMYDVLRDLASLKKDVVCFKAAQIGFSTAAILTTLWISKNKGIDLIYTLPTQADVQQFAGGKINRIIAQNPVMQDWVKDKDTVEHKAVGDNIIYYRGTFSQKAAMMVSSDLNAYDEIDASKQDVVEQYSTRLQASRLKREWFFSHPSAPGIGVDKHWGRSDQKHWFVKCSHCEEEQYMDFPQSFDLENEKYICKYCKGEIYDDDRRRGRWVARYKDKELSGYWIPLFICPWVSAKEIIGYHKNKSAEYFTNKVLGLPYVGGGNKLTKGHFERNLTDDVIMPDTDERIVIGVDTGVNLHYVVGGAYGIFEYGEASPSEDNGHDPYKEIEYMLNRWKRSIAVIDQGGDLIGSRKLREKYPGRVFLCLFGTDRKTKELIRWGKNDEQGAVTADRNRCIQLVVDEFSDSRIPVEGNSDEWYDYWLHWNNLTRIKEYDTKTNEFKRFAWVRSGDDHWALSTVYWRVGMSKFSQKGSILSTEKSLVQTAPTIYGDKIYNDELFEAMKYNEQLNDDWRD